jgi:hypothetical protein
VVLLRAAKMKGIERKMKRVSYKKKLETQVFIYFSPPRSVLYDESSNRAQGFKKKKNVRVQRVSGNGEQETARKRQKWSSEAARRIWGGASKYTHLTAQWDLIANRTANKKGVGINVIGGKTICGKEN